MFSSLCKIYFKKNLRISFKRLNSLSQHCILATNSASDNLTRGYTILHSSNIHESFVKQLDYRTNVFHFNDQIWFSNSSNQELDAVQFIETADATLDSLTDYFDELVEAAPHLNEADVSCRDGVLTVKFGDSYGTYVINRQTPNKQIWLSSPESGPKRYDFINKKWIYKHDGKSIYQLLDEEIPSIVKSKTCFENKCAHISEN